MFEVQIAAEAREQIASLPLAIQARTQAIVDRLWHWPIVSGVKPLRGPLKGLYRIRTGDYRVIFRVNAASRRIVVLRVADRRDVYG